MRLQQQELPLDFATWTFKKARHSKKNPIKSHSFLLVVVDDGLQIVMLGADVEKGVAAYPQLAMFSRSSATRAAPPSSTRKAP
jgi:hypothetical protein